MTDPVNATGIEQADYLKLFMQELTYQDPLKPVDNREFMAQMAQFSALQEAKSSNEILVKLLGMTSGTQSLTLLGKQVRIQDGEQLGYVTKVEFTANKPPKLSIKTNDTEIPGIELSQIIEVNN